MYETADTHLKENGALRGPRIMVVYQDSAGGTHRRQEGVAGSHEDLTLPQLAGLQVFQVLLGLLYVQVQTAFQGRESEVFANKTYRRRCRKI